MGTWDGVRNPQKVSINAGSEPRDVAAYYWGFGYDPDERALRLGPFKIEVSEAVPAALGLAEAIYAAAREVDRQRAVGESSR